MKFKVIDNKTNLEWYFSEISKEDWVRKELIWMDLEGFAVEEDGTLVLLDECGRYVYPPEGRFSIHWIMDTDEIE